MGASALCPWEAGGGRTVDEWRSGENLSSSSAEAGTQPICAQVPCPNRSTLPATPRQLPVVRETTVMKRKQTKRSRLPLCSPQTRCRPHTRKRKTTRPQGLPIQQMRTRKLRRKRMTSVWRPRGKDVSPSDKASCSEPRTHVLPGVLATNMRFLQMAPHGTGSGLLEAELAVSSQKRSLTATPQHLLRRYYRGGHPAGLVDKRALPYVLPWHNALSEADWQRRVGWFCHSRYLHDMDALYAERAWSKFDTFYRAMDLTNPIQAMRYDQANSEQAKQAKQVTQVTQAEQAKQDEQAKQVTVPAQPTTTEPNVLTGPHLADRVTAARFWLAVRG